MPKMKEHAEGVIEDDLSALSADNNIISTQAVLNFIDLAGSERANIHDPIGKSNLTMGASIRNSSPYASQTQRSNSNNRGGMGAS